MLELERQELIMSGASEKVGLDVSQKGGRRGEGGYTQGSKCESQQPEGKLWGHGEHSCPL